ncbi:peptide chain release factor 1 [Nanoarchaeota archaeon]|nr:MAG: peptide chain release factor 1 [Nanoarchaeota archaeon]
MFMQASKLKLKRLIDELESYRGRHTELVTVYVPAGYNLDSVRQQLAEEQSTASNIKSKSTRKNVIDALEKIQQELKLYPKTPPNGLIIFCGNVSDREGKQDLRLWAFEPPEPINVRIYRCDQKFVLEPLKELLQPKAEYGLIAIDNSEATIGLLSGKRVVVLKNMDSLVPNKFRVGGQSANRFQNVRENLKKAFYKQVADAAENAFSSPDIKGIIIGGPGPVKENFYNGNYLSKQLKQKVLAVKDISYTNEYGLTELVERSKDVIKERELYDEKEAVRRLMYHIAKDDLAVYGEKDVVEALSMGAVELLLLSETLDNEKIEHLSHLAKETGADVIVVSNDTPEGEQLASLSGVAAILRYKLK